MTYYKQSLSDNLTNTAHGNFWEHLDYFMNQIMPLDEQLNLLVQRNHLQSR